MRRGAFFAVLAAMLALAPPAVAVVPPGPRLGTVELINTKGSEREEKATAPFMSLATIDPSEGGERRFLRSKLEAAGRVTPTPFTALPGPPTAAGLRFSAIQRRRTENHGSMS